MLFEIFNDKDTRVFITHYESCIPEKSDIDSMLKSGHKFRLDSKLLTKKALNELINK